MATDNDDDNFNDTITKLSSVINNKKLIISNNALNNNLINISQPVDTIISDKNKNLPVIDSLVNISSAKNKIFQINSDNISQQVGPINKIRSIKIKCPDIDNIFNITEEEIKKNPELLVNINDNTLKLIDFTAKKARYFFLWE